MPCAQCIGIVGGGGKCKLSRVKPGARMNIRGPCGRCGERRCRTHCRCGRNGTAQGRSAARPLKRAALEAVDDVAVSGATAASALAPIGRPSPLAVDVLKVEEWWDRVLEELSGATHVLVATYVIDHGRLCALFERRLSGRSEFHLEILVDKESLESRTCVHQRPRLDSLRRAGAKVYACRGQPPLGALHMKMILLDRRAAFGGSANVAQKRLENAELTMRVRGPPVNDFLAQALAVKARGALWDGS